MNKIYIDIGGTNIEIKFDLDNKVIDESFKVNSMNKDELLSEIAKRIEEKKLKDVSIGISSPTAVETNTGFCNGLSGITDYANFNLYEELKNKFSNTKILTLVATNDGNAALLGILVEEFREKPKSAVMIALGTGIGGSIYINGEIFTGTNNMAGELGYPIWENNKNISQSLSPVNVFKTINPNISGRDIMNSYEFDKKIKYQVDEWIDGLSKFVSYISFFINPDVVVFNGGIFKNEKFKKLLEKKYHEYLVENELSNLSNTKLLLLKDSKNYALSGAKELLNHTSKKSGRYK